MEQERRIKRDSTICIEENKKMEIDITEDGTICLKKVFNGILLETSDGNQISICMRDDTFEINVIPKDKSSHWHRVDMDSGEIVSEKIVL